MQLPRVLVVAADRELQSIAQPLGRRGFDVAQVYDTVAARELLAAGAIDALLIDDGLDDDGAILRAFRSSHPRSIAVVISGRQSVPGAVRAMKLGAREYLSKPIDLVALAAVLQPLGAPRATAPRSNDPFLGASAQMARLSDVAHRLAESDHPILILGETGVGKGVLANWLHRHGPRAKGPFVDLNCGGFSREFLESELFGHEKGAFTGAVASKLGMLEVADGGVVFLDEVGDLDAQVQPKVVKVLEEKRFHRIGEVRDRYVDVHLIAATHQNLDALVEQRLFRSDLYFRISALPLLVPPIRERKEDIPALARALLEDTPICTAALEALKQHHWPGNIREMKNLLWRARLLAGGEPIGVEHISFDSGAAVGHAGAKPWCSDTSLTLRAMEKQYIHTILGEERGRVEMAARRLGVPRSSLYHKLKEHGLRRGV